jgi:hypothetical protein
LQLLTLETHLLLRKLEGQCQQTAHGDLGKGLGHSGLAVNRSREWGPDCSPDGTAGNLASHPGPSLDEFPCADPLSQALRKRARSFCSLGELPFETVDFRCEVFDLGGHLLETIPSFQSPQNLAHGLFDGAPEFLCCITGALQAFFLVAYPFPHRLIEAPRCIPEFSEPLGYCLNDYVSFDSIGHALLSL